MRNVSVKKPCCCEDDPGLWQRFDLCTCFPEQEECPNPCWRFVEPEEELIPRGDVWIMTDGCCYTATDITTTTKPSPICTLDEPHEDCEDCCHLKPEPQGVCCKPDEEGGGDPVCTILLDEAECNEVGGIWFDEETSCEPNPCPEQPNCSDVVDFCGDELAVSATHNETITLGDPNPPCCCPDECFFIAFGATLSLLPGATSTYRGCGVITHAGCSCNNCQCGSWVDAFSNTFCPPCSEAGPTTATCWYGVTVTCSSGPPSEPPEWTVTLRWPGTSCLHPLGEVNPCISGGVCGTGSTGYTASRSAGTGYCFPRPFSAEFTKPNFNIDCFNDPNSFTSVSLVIT